MAIIGSASVQAVLDTTAQGRGVRIVCSARVSSSVNSFYVVPVITSAGRSRWIDTNTSSSATAQTSTITTALAKP